MRLIDFSLVMRLLIFQLSSAITITAVFWIYSGYEAGLSAVLGGMTGIVPGLIFALLYFKYSGALAAKKVVRGFYLGEALKLITTLLLFTAAFQWSKLKPLPMFTVFIATLMAYWIVLGQGVAKESPEVKIGLS